MKLVSIENYEIKIEDELLLLKPFRKLWKQDKTKDKEHFTEFIGILYFLKDPRSDYQYILNEKDRLLEICNSNGYAEPKWTKEEIECRDIYEKLTTTSSLELLKDAQAIAQQIRTVLKSIQWYDIDEEKKVTACKNAASILSMIPKIVKDLTETEKIVNKEVEEAGRARGNSGSKSLMDDGVML